MNYRNLIWLLVVLVIVVIIGLGAMNIGAKIKGRLGPDTGGSQILNGTSTSGSEQSSSSNSSSSTGQGSTQYEITIQDNGKAFSYPLTSRFTVILDQNQYPKNELSCEPGKILGSISNIPAVQAPLYASRFEIVDKGTCILKDRGFSVTIQGF